MSWSANVEVAAKVLQDGQPGQRVGRAARTASLSAWIWAILSGFL